MPGMPPRIGEAIHYQTDERNGLRYELPAIITVTERSHPGDYPSGEDNPLVQPQDTEVHLTVFTPGGFGSAIRAGDSGLVKHPRDDEYVGAPGFIPGSGSYVEHSVPHDRTCQPRTWHWPHECETLA